MDFTWKHYHIFVDFSTFFRLKFTYNDGRATARVPNRHQAKRWRGMAPKKGATTY